VAQFSGRLVVGKGIRQRLIVAFSFLVALIVMVSAIGAWRLFQLQGALAEMNNARGADPRIAQAVASADEWFSLLLVAGGAAALIGLFYAWQVTVAVTKPLRRAAHVARQVADGDLRVHLEASQINETGHLLQALVHMADRLRSLLSDVTTGVRTAAEASAQIAQGNLDLSRRTEHQASTLEETASSMEQLTSTVAQNAQSAREASQLAVTATGVAQKGGDAVEQVLLTMDEILDASKKIADITSVIDSIAFQTNILALNAAVEAARAGEQGRGFAVVAAEVRSLAQRSATAAKEIRSLIADTTRKVQAGSNVADGAGHTMVEVVGAIKKVSDLVAEIAAASNEQSEGIAQVNTALTQMDQAVQQNAALAEEATSATESMKQQTDWLLQLVSRFKLGQGSESQVHWAPQPRAERKSIRSRLGLGERDSGWGVQDSEFSELR
jgi:methyl-accepting chemotaxis protein